MRTLFVTLGFLLFAFVANAGQVYQTSAEFVEEAFGGEEPVAKAIWLTGDLEKRVTNVLGHAYRDLRVRYWVLGDSGLLVEFAEEGALTGALASLVSDPAERQRVGARGLERVRNTFAWDVLRPQYLSFFAEVADRDFKPRSCYD